MCRSQTEHADVEYAESGAASTLCQDHRGLVGETSYAVPVVSLLTVIDSMLRRSG